MDFGPVKVGVEVETVYQYSASDLDERDLSSKHQVSNGPIRNSEVASGLVLRQ
jgi:hypothetical protein